MAKQTLKIRCPECKQFKTLTKSNITGMLFAFGVLLLPLFGAGVVFIFMAGFHHLFRKADYYCPNCGYELNKKRNS